MHGAGTNDSSVLSCSYGFSRSSSAGTSNLHRYTMLLSFLATLEDGFSVSTSVSKKDAQSRLGETTVEGETGLKNIASLLGLHMSLTGQYARKTTADSDVEEKFIREHTAASM